MTRISSFPEEDSGSRRARLDRASPVSQLLDKPPPPSEPEVAQTGMIVGTTAERPVIKTVLFADRQIVDAREAHAHQTVLVELPVLIAVAAEPASRIVSPFVGETNGAAVVVKGPEFLDQPIIELAVPFAGQKRLDRRPTLKELRAVPPPAVFGIGERDAGRVTGVPGVLRHARLLRRGFLIIGWQRRSTHGSRSPIPPPAGSPRTASRYSR